jgi:uncharacterized protein YcfL
MVRESSVIVGTLTCLLLWVLLVTTTGCITSGTTGTLEESPSGEFSEYIDASNIFLSSKLSIESMAMRDVGDLKQVQFVLHNRRHTTQDFEYKVVWYDGDGFAIDPDSRPWNPLTMRGKDSHPITATSPRASATTFKVHLKK